MKEGWLLWTCDVKDQRITRRSWPTHRTHIGPYENFTLLCLLPHLHDITSMLISLWLSHSCYIDIEWISVRISIASGWVIEWLSVSSMNPLSWVNHFAREHGSWCCIEATLAPVEHISISSSSSPPTFRHLTYVGMIWLHQIRSSNLTATAAAGPPVELNPKIRFPFSWHGEAKCDPKCPLLTWSHVLMIDDMDWTHGMLKYPTLERNQRKSTNLETNL